MCDNAKHNANIPICNLVSYLLYNIIRKLSIIDIMNMFRTSNVLRCVMLKCGVRMGSSSKLDENNVRQHYTKSILILHKKGEYFPLLCRAINENRRIDYYILSRYIYISTADTEMCAIICKQIKKDSDINWTVVVNNAIRKKNFLLVSEVLKVTKNYPSIAKAVRYAPRIKNVFPVLSIYADIPMIETYKNKKILSYEMIKAIGFSGDIELIKHVISVFDIMNSEDIYKYGLVEGCCQSGCMLLIKYIVQIFSSVIRISNEVIFKNVLLSGNLNTIAYIMKSNLFTKHIVTFTIEYIYILLRCSNYDTVQTLTREICDCDFSWSKAIENIFDYVSPDVYYIDYKKFTEIILEERNYGALEIIYKKRKTEYAHASNNNKRIKVSNLYEFTADEVHNYLQNYLTKKCKIAIKLCESVELKIKKYDSIMSCGSVDLLYTTLLLNTIGVSRESLKSSCIKAFIHGNYKVCLIILDLEKFKSSQDIVLLKNRKSRITLHSLIDKNIVEKFVSALHTSIEKWSDCMVYYILLKKKLNRYLKKFDN